MKFRNAGIKDVAKMANVSISTVSLVMNGGNVSEDKRAQVEAAIEKLQYVPQGHGRSLRSGRSHSVGFFVLNSSPVKDLSLEASDFWFQLILGFEKICREHDYYFAFDSLNWDSTDRMVRRALGRLNDGAIIFPQYKYNYGFLKQLSNANYPLVFYNPWIPVENSQFIKVEDREAQSELVKLLIEKGHSKICLINGPKNHVDSQARYEGYKDAHNHFGIPVQEDRVAWSDFTFQGGYSTTKVLVKNQMENLTAIACGNDYLAIGAIHALKDSGLNVPGDVAVTGFGGHDVSFSVIPRLTTMQIPTNEVGRALGMKLFSQIDGKPDQNLTSYRPQLIVGGST